MARGCSCRDTTSLEIGQKETIRGHGRFVTSLLAALVIHGCNNPKGPNGAGPFGGLQPKAGNAPIRG